MRLRERGRRQPRDQRLRHHRHQQQHHRHSGCDVTLHGESEILSGEFRSARRWDAGGEAVEVGKGEEVKVSSAKIESKSTYIT